MKVRTLAVLAALVASSSVFAQSKPEDQIRLRQGGLELLARNIGALNAVAKGDTPFNKEAVAQKADFINYLVPEIWAAGFPAGSDKALPTRANPKIWSDQAGFKAAQDKLVAAVKKLEGVGDVNALKAALGDVGGACKNCHDNYRDSSYH